ncbi:CDP-glycerol glycerophosphotransferase, TagB/SpsB family [Salinibacillus kushneri]|uniref:CDP-glycerol glycerophosphotransferase, TagB/SpsB family n=1 Tax=Salinibacillus kushneri TaxID=237682 RepID=A0A1I0JGK9_9BACI|nr:CDP-glycerol glycerophosphotransferase family protein [Salinibacillus kushneri]SEU09308.1 CDP-glycerol glycerophosphotransferase, TagB/SpsB family [Salinibacillus kushneri]
MKVQVYLDKTYNIDDQYVQIEMLLNSDNNEMIKNKINGLYLFKENLSEKVFLTANITLSGNKIYCIVPMEKLNELTFDNSGWNFKLELNLDNDKVLLSVLNRLKQSKTILVKSDKRKLELVKIYKQNKRNFELCSFKKDIDSVRIIADEVDIIKAKNHQLNIKSRIKPFVTNKNYKFNKFFLWKSNTEITELDKVKVEKLRDGYFFQVDLSGLALYEGDWELFASIEIDESKFVVSVKYQGAQLQGDLYRLYDNFYFYNIDFNNRRNFVISTRKGSAKRMFFVNDIKLQRNHLLLNIDIDANIEDFNITDIVFQNRDTKKEYKYNIVKKTDIQNGTLLKEINLYYAPFIYDHSIWDVYIAYEHIGIKSSSKVSFYEKDLMNHDFIVLPKTVYNQEGYLKRLRPYYTLDKNLAILVNEDVLKCDVFKITYEENNLNINGRLTIPDLEYSLLKIYLEDEEQQLKLTTNNKIYQQNGFYYFESSYDWSQFDLENIQDNLDFSYYIDIDIVGDIYKVPLVSNLDDIRNKSKIMIYPSLYKNINGYPADIKPYYTEDNNLKVFISNSLDVQCNKIESNKDHIKLYLRIEALDVINNSKPELLLEERNTGMKIIEKLKSEKDCFSVKINKKLLHNHDVDNKTVWSLFCRVQTNNHSIKASIYCDDAILINGNSTFKSNAQEYKGNLKYSVFISKKSRSPQLEVRELYMDEFLAGKIKNFFAKLSAKVIGKFVKKPVWLIGENLGEVAQDNGFAFFKYCIENNIPEDFYYISKDNNKNIDNLVPYQNKVIKYDSMKHLIKYHLSDYLIVAHGIRDVIPGYFHRRMGRNPKKVIYLQHGIIAMKKLDFNSKSYNSKIRKFVSSSTFEKNILVNKMNFKEKQIMITGLARFDSLKDNSINKTTREIVVIPTWRDWLIDSRNEFLESDFYKRYHDLLHDKRLHSILEENNLVLKFFPHIEIQKKYIKDFQTTNKRVQIVDVGKESVQDLIQNSSLMISDYSSVIFDFNYLQKPIIFYHFDTDEYMKYRGSYVDLKSDLIGDAAYNHEDLIQYIQEYIQNNFEYKEKYAIQSKKYYNFKDRNNSKRIYDEIKKLY